MISSRDWASVSTDMDGSILHKDVFLARGFRQQAVRQR
jgi:hypothetical protein